MKNEIKNEIKKIISGEKEICLQKMDVYFQNYIEKEFEDALIKIIEEIQLTKKEKAVLSMPRSELGKIKKHQDEILEKYYYQVFPQYAKKLESWCLKTYQEVLSYAAKEIESSLLKMVFVQELDQTVQINPLNEILIMIMRTSNELVSCFPNYAQMYKAFNCHILSPMELGTAFKIYICPEIKTDIKIYLSDLRKKTSESFDKLEEEVLKLQLKERVEQYG